MNPVNCVACGTENPADSRFCEECGTPLALSCPTCGAAVTPGRKFCGKCGTALAAPPTAPAVAPPVPVSPASVTAAPVAERRMCSVLFVDLVGFTTTSESRDPEEVRELLGAYFDLARNVVGRYGGLIEKFIGDAVMAVWGTPVATEQDAERAVRAAIDLVDSVHQLGDDRGISGLAARAGVLTGEVAVTIGATNQGMVAGDAVNTAARIQAAARPGTVFVDAITRRLTAGAILYGDEGEHALKGKTEPEHLWRAGQVVSAIGGSQRTDGLEAPLTGRGAELRSLREMFHASAERRQPRLMLVSGPAGVGKSRLGWEFEKYIDGLATSVWWHRGRCLSYGEGMVYWAIAEVVRQRLQIAEDDSPAVAAARLAEGLARWVPDAAERDYLSARLGRLLGVARADAGPSLSREDLFAGWRRFFEYLAAEQPVVILIEDLHNAASDLLDFLDHLVDWSRDLPIFVLGFARPELEGKRSGFASGRNRATITLDPLDTTSMEAIVDALVPGMPADATRTIVSRAEGIPLYALESIRSLIDRGVIQPDGDTYRLVGGTAALAGLAVPDSLHALLAARLDALDPVARKVVGDASVLGASFPAEAVVAVSGLDEADAQRVLADLLRREVFRISADRLSPERGNYGFAQEMLRQVAYETLSRRDRKARHLAVAAHLRATFAGDGEEVIDAVARHYADALDAAPDDPDAPELRGLLVEMLIRAARHASSAGSPLRASQNLTAAGDLLEATDAPRAAGLWLQAVELGRVGGGWAGLPELAQRAREVYLVAGDARQAARALIYRGRAVRFLGRFSEGLAMIAAGLAELGTEPSLERAEGLMFLSPGMTTEGEDPEGKVSEEALALGFQLRVGDDFYANLLRVRGMYFDSVGDRRMAAALYREAARLAEQVGAADIILNVAGNLTNALMVDRPAEVIEPATKALALAERLGLPFASGLLLSNLGLALVSVGDWDATAAFFEDSQDRSSWPDLQYITVTHAMLLALRGDAAAARALVEPLLGLLDSEDPQDRSMVHTDLALIALADGDPDAALDHALASIGELGPWVGFGGDDGRWCWPLAARIAHDLGRYDQEADLLARLEAEPLGAPADMQFAEGHLIRARLAAVRGEDAVPLFTSAIDALRADSTPYHLAHGLLDLADHLQSLQAESPSTELVDEAAAIAERLRCRPLRERADALAARLAAAPAGV